MGLIAATVWVVGAEAIVKTIKTNVPQIRVWMMQLVRPCPMVILVSVCQVLEVCIVKATSMIALTIHARMEEHVSMEQTTTLAIVQINLWAKIVTSHMTYVMSIHVKMAENAKRLARDQPHLKKYCQRTFIVNAFVVTMATFAKSILTTAKRLPAQQTKYALIL